MKATSNTNEPNRDDAVTRELLLLADRQEVEPPRDVLDRVRARLHENTVRSPSAAPARATAPWTKRAWFAGASAAAVVLIALLFCLQPSSIAWSQVAEAVRAMPWIHMKVVAGRGQSAETWISFSRNVAAMRAAQMVSYDDLRSGIRYQYDLPQKKLYRLSVNDGAAEEIASVVGLFQAIFRGDAIREGDLFRLRIVKQRQQTVTEQGRRWILYELELEPQGGGPKPPVEIPPISMVIRVNPEKMLPRLVDHHSREVRSDAARLEDRYSRSGESRDRLRLSGRGPGGHLCPGGAARCARRRSHAAAGPGPNHKDCPAKPARFRRLSCHCRRKHGVPSCIVIRCKGDKFRIDDGIGDTRHVASAADMEQWWQERGKEVLLAGRILSDGRRAYEHNFVQPQPWWQPSTQQVRQGDGRAAACGPRRRRVSPGRVLCRLAGVSAGPFSRKPVVGALANGSPRPEGRKRTGRECSS